MNSFCGINLAAHALRRGNRPYDYLYTQPGDPKALGKIEILESAGKVRRKLRQAWIGRVGEHPVGIESCLFNREGLTSRLGVKVVQIQLEKVFQLARQGGVKAYGHLLEGRIISVPKGPTAFSGINSVP